MDALLTFARDGAQRFTAALSADEIAALELALTEVPAAQAGVRLHGLPDLARTIGAPGRIAEAMVGAGARAVRAVLFDKTADANWSLAWHQDRTIVVRERRETPGFGPWSVKQGLQHVEPPFGILAGMATLRLHLDRVTPDNAPLLIACGSHRIGRVAAEKTAAVATEYPIAACLAERGDVWAYATPILHASEASRTVSGRRVLQIDYSTADLPAGLEWLGL